MCNIMKYSINPMIFTSMFPLPTSIADEHIRSANLPQMKIILWIFRHSSEGTFSSKAIADAVGLYESEVDDAINYWISCGIISCQDKTTNDIYPTLNAAPEKTVTFAPSAPKEKESEPTVKKVVESIHINPPTHEEVSKRCRESQDLRDLFLTTEQRIGSTLSYSMQGTLVMIHDDYGLSVEVISLLIEYAISRNKVTTRFIANTGRLWCEKEIDTIDKAMDYIEQVGNAEKYWEEFREKTGVKNPSPTKQQREHLHSWINNMGFSMDMIVLAYEEMANNTDKFSFPYMNKVLVNWHKAGYTTPVEVALSKKEWQERLNSSKKTKSKNQPEPVNASYDLDAYTKKAFSNPLNILNNKE